jgi:DGQHR domain-containing protein
MMSGDESLIMSNASNKFVIRKALKVSQKGGRFVYLLSLKAEELLQFASVSRLSRDDDEKLIGYQRPEVKRHVQEIIEYLESPNMLLAHPLILSFGSEIKFVSSRGANTSDGMAVAGSLRIPVPSNEGEKPAWIVDGQQRALAITRCKDKSFPVPICAFIADDVELQRDQFLRINNTKPLPRGLVTELLPEVSSPLPPRMAIKKIPSALCDLLNRDEKSPFRNLIRRPSGAGKSETLTKQAVVTDTIIVKMIEESLTNPSGCLFPYRNMGTGQFDHNAIWAILHMYWSAVRDTFPEAWGKPPTESRLMHGVGIRAMGRLMDRIMNSVNYRQKDSFKTVRRDLALIAPMCRWNSGKWEELGGIGWNELQNFHKHLAMLSNFLVRAYLEKRQDWR